MSELALPLFFAPASHRRWVLATSVVLPPLRRFLLCVVSSQSELANPS